MAAIIQLAVQNGKHLLSYIGVLHGVPLEDGAGPPVCLRDEEVEIRP